MSVIKILKNSKIAKSDKFKLLDTRVGNNVFLEVLLSYLPNPLVVTDLEGKIILVTNKTSEVHGYKDPEDLVDTDMLSLIAENERQAAIENMEELSKIPINHIRHTLIKKDGSNFPAEISISPLIINDKVVALVSIMRDITEQLKKEEELINASIMDKLTGLFNRRFFEEELVRLQNSRHFPISLLVADVDNLKATNDKLGHLKGDELLQNAARILKKTFRRTDDDIFRIGGDEFVVIIQDSKINAVKILADKLRENLRKEKLPASIGLSTAKDHSESLWSVFEKADGEMYKEKYAKKW